MAWPKILNQILNRLDKIEARLDKIIDSDNNVSSPKVVYVPPKEPLIPEYEKSTVADVLRRVKTMSPEDKASFLEYEKRHKNRTLVIEALEKQ